MLELAGIHNVLTKIYGSRSPKNVVKAVMAGLLKLQNKQTIESLRGVQIEA
jgi:small subunit ribosomal protein S5